MVGKVGRITATVVYTSRRLICFRVGGGTSVRAASIAARTLSLLFNISCFRFALILRHISGNLSRILPEPLYPRWETIPFSDGGFCIAKYPRRTPSKWRLSDL